MFEEDEDKYKIIEVDEEEVAKQKEIEWKNKYQLDVIKDEGILPRDVRRDKIIGVLKSNYGIDHNKNTKLLQEIKEKKCSKIGENLPPVIPRK